MLLLWLGRDLRAAAGRHQLRRLSLQCRHRRVRVACMNEQVGIELTRGGDRERDYTEIGQIGRSFDRENLVIESGEG